MTPSRSATQVWHQFLAVDVIIDVRKSLILRKPKSLLPSTAAAVSRLYLEWLRSVDVERTRHAPL
jgi:hypothetical protein